MDLLPIITAAAGDRFNSDPTDPNLMGPEVLSKYERGEEIEAAQIKTPLVSSWAGKTALINCQARFARWTWSRNYAI